jgi:hypothetical protein
MFAIYLFQVVQTQTIYGMQLIVEYYLHWPPHFRIYLFQVVQTQTITMQLIGSRIGKYYLYLHCNIFSACTAVPFHVITSSKKYIEPDHAASTQKPKENVLLIP